MQSAVDWSNVESRQLFESAEAMMRHPRFEVAVATLVDGLANLYGDDRRLVRNLFEYQRAVTFMIAVCLDAERQEDDPGTWLTVGALAESAAVMGIGPVRRVRRIVEEMRADGMLLAQPKHDDRRHHALRASERMLAIDREWLAAFHAPLLQLVPDEPRYRAAVARDPGYHRFYRRRGRAMLPMANRIVTRNPVVDPFMHNRAGARLLALLLQAARSDPDGWTPPGFFSMAATRSATTRVHVRTVMRVAEESGLIESGSELDGRLRVTQTLRDGFARWAAESLVGIDFTGARL